MFFHSTKDRQNGTYQSIHNTKKIHQRYTKTTPQFSTKKEQLQGSLVRLGKWVQNFQMMLLLNREQNHNGKAWGEVERLLLLILLPFLSQIHQPPFAVRCGQIFFHSLLLFEVRGGIIVISANTENLY